MFTLLSNKTNKKAGAYGTRQLNKKAYFQAPQAS
jgi:hypothetical protein